MVDQGLSLDYIVANDEYYTDTYIWTFTTTQNWSDPFSVSSTISDTSIIDQLLNTSQLPFDLQVMGDLVLTSGTLTLDVTEIPSDEVPEPASLALASIALCGLAYGRRRKRSVNRVCNIF
jgi:hypothetical protein